jgi:hypothetical protein
MVEGGVGYDVVGWSREKKDAIFFGLGAGVRGGEGTGD